jgi:hypothetical protein
MMFLEDPEWVLIGNATFMSTRESSPDQKLLRNENSQRPARNVMRMSKLKELVKLNMGHRA